MIKNINTHKKSKCIYFTNIITIFFLKCRGQPTNFSNKKAPPPYYKNMNMAPRPSLTEYDVASKIILENST